MSGNVAGAAEQGAAEQDAGGNNPALRMVAIGCQAKFRFGRGFAIGKRQL